MKSRFIIFMHLLFALQLSAQQVIQYEPGFVFREGVYLNFDQFKNNSPIPKSAIISKLNHANADFMESIMDEKSFTYKEKNDSLITINTNTVWGFSRNDNILIRVEDDYNRIPVLGSISHFVATITVYYNNMSSPFFNPYYGSNTMQNTRQELKQMILDFQTGRTMDFTQENLVSILLRNSKLFDEYNRLKKSQKKDLMFLYLRKYNEKHPIFFPAE